MKKTILALLALVLVVSSLALPTLAVDTGKDYGKVPATDAVITIDGTKDAIYDKGLTVAIDVPWKSNVNSELTGEGKVLWNGKDTFYVFVEVKDKDVLTYTGDISQKDPAHWLTDAVEVFFDYTNEGKVRHQYHIGAMGDVVYNNGSGNVFGEAVKDNGFVAYAATKTATGYSVEIQVKPLDDAMKADAHVGFHIMANDMVAGTRNRWHSDDSDSAVSLMGFITLSAEKVAVEAPKPETTAAPVTTAAPTTTAPASTPATADAAPVLLLVAAAALSSVCVLKKKD